ncbi:lytic polysaccharide monooxygenase [Streptomyces mirabilis]|uniref:lytic polysaccharide monooxygenase n=1 Tax=Streptomyces mirabilis TaxID=68239 RepID=UPI0034090934
MQTSAQRVRPISWWWALLAVHLLRPHWDPSAPLSRDQFEPEPFATYKPYGDIPHWEMPDASTDPNLDKPHTIRLPERSGYHVVLGVWEVADTGHAFYQVMDANFTH